MSNKIVARLEGDASYSDNTRGAFAVQIDDDGTIVQEGAASAMGDIIATIKALFTALGGTLTCTPPTSGKTVIDKTASFSVHGIYNDVSFKFWAVYTLKSGTVISLNGVTEYDIAVAQFNSLLDGMITAMAGVATTIA